MTSYQQTFAHEQDEQAQLKHLAVLSKQNHAMTETIKRLTLENKQRLREIQEASRQRDALLGFSPRKHVDMSSAQHLSPPPPLENEQLSIHEMIAKTEQESETLKQNLLWLRNFELQLKKHQQDDVDFNAQIQNQEI